MADHADHHHAVEQKPAPGVAMGIGLFVGMAALLVGFVGAIRASESPWSAAFRNHATAASWWRSAVSAAARTADGSRRIAIAPPP